MNATELLPEKTLKIGSELSFDSAGFDTTLQAANKIKKDMEEVREKYNELSIGEFTNEVLSELLSDEGGISPLRLSLSNMIEKDLSGFANQLMRKQANAHAEECLQKLQSAIDALQHSFHASRSISSYPLQTKDFSVYGQVEILIAPIRKFYSKRLETETQLQVYHKLQELARVYNDTIETIQDAGFRNPKQTLGYGNAAIIGQFLKVRNEEESALGTFKGRKVDVAKTSILQIK